MHQITHQILFWLCKAYNNAGDDVALSLMSCITTSVYLNHTFVLSGGAPTPAGTSVFTKHNWDMKMGYLWLNGWGIYHLMGGAFMAYWVGHL